MAPPRPVEFSAFDGTILRGNLYLPDKMHAPVIILAVGLTFLKEHFGEIPGILRDAGYAVLVHDPRNWGSSDGTPRQHINLHQQSDDVSDAITFACAQAPAIDPERVCVMGGGHGGGVIMPVAATDPRVKAAIVAMPFMSGLLDSKAWPEGHMDLLWKERGERASNPQSSEEPVYVPIFPESLEAAEQNPQSTVIGHPHIVGFRMGVKSFSDAAGTLWENKITLQTLFHQRRWEPTAFLPQISIPFLYITAKHDEFNHHETHMQAYEKVSGPKDLLILDSENLAAFAMEKPRREMMEKQLAFLNDNLRRPG